ncbi:MAG: hypothetical protein QM426_10550 [Euryarchaeota archaeon]|nr:hypothetical protein [Euryarchaeota archaeon]
MINLIRRLYWSKLKPDKTPKWVLNAAHDFENKYGLKYGHSPFEKTIYFTGKTFKYKVCFKTPGQGENYVTVYRKLR